MVNPPSLLQAAYLLLLLQTLTKRKTVVVLARPAVVSTRPTSLLLPPLAPRCVV